MSDNQDGLRADLEYVEVGGVDDLSDGQMVPIEIGGQRVLVAKVDGEFYAISGVCTHERANLDEGALVGTTVYCPRHYSAFDLRTGRVLGPPAEESACKYAVKIDDGKVCISGEPLGEEEAEIADADDGDARLEPRHPARPWHARLVGTVDGVGWLKPVGNRLVERIAPLRRNRVAASLLDLLHGRWLGHALHPTISDLPIGFWISAFLLYLVGLPTAGVILTVAGIVTALAAVVTGFADWTATDGHERRVGLFHGLIMLVALAVQIAAAVAFVALPAPAATVLSGVGVVIMLAGAYLGGHLVFGSGTMVDHAVVSPAINHPIDWTDIDVTDEELAAGESRSLEVEGRPVLVYRDEAGGVFCMDATCSHAGAPLGLGEVCEGEVRCPWHDSRFRLRDGAVLQGPATFPQPLLQVRSVGGRIQVRAAPSGGGGG